ncbi:MAG: hypothetical protein R3C11_20250 [Planctomycetaceae bacterium]
MEIERDAAMRAARESELARRAVSMSDVINMSQQGLSDETILLAAQTRGCQIDMNPNNLIYMKEQGLVNL